MSCLTHRLKSWKQLVYQQGSNCLFSSWPLSVLLHIPTHKGSKGKLWCSLQNLMWKGANQSSLCRLRRPQTSAEILPRVYVLPQLRFCCFSSRKLPEYIQHVESLFLVLLLLNCLVFGQWLNFSLLCCLQWKWEQQIQNQSKVVN